MADNDFNVIKPVESLQNIQRLTPAKRRQERKRQRNAPADHQEEPKEEHDDAEDRQTLDDNGKARSIDYCA